MAIYVLIDSNNDIVDKIDSITPGGAEYYFMKRKQIEDVEKFYEVWKSQFGVGLLQLQLG